MDVMLGLESKYFHGARHVEAPLPYFLTNVKSVLGYMCLHSGQPLDN